MEKQQEIIIKRVSFWEFLLVLGRKFKKKPSFPAESTQESAKVKALNKQVSALEKINDSLICEIDGLVKLVGNNKQNNMQDKIIDIATNLFTPTKNAGGNLSLNHFSNEPPAYTHTAGRQLETGTEYSDEQLKGIISALPAKYRRMASKLPQSVVISHIKKEIPDISETSIKRGLELLQE